MALPHARYLLIKNKTKGQDSFVDGVLEGGYKAELEAAKRIYDSKTRKGYVEACMLASNDLDEISELLEIPVQELAIYRDLFFDVSRMNKLDRLDVIAECTDDAEVTMKTWAMAQGLDFIRWRLGKGVEISPVDGIKSLYHLAVFKSREAMFSGNAAESSKEAVKWGKLSMDLARILKNWVVDKDAASSDIALALKTLSPDFKGYDGIDDIGSIEALGDPTGFADLDKI